jgi:hypothetical protein
MGRASSLRRSASVIATPELRRIRARMRTDACWKAQHIFGFTPWSKQREILESVRRNPRTAVRSSHGTGKTATAARVVLDWITEGRGIVVTTAPTWHQVEGQLWKEIATAVRQSVIPVGGKLTSTRLEIAKDWVAYGLSTDQPERFQGEHSPRLLLVVDEASGVDEAIFQAAQGYLTAEGSSVLLLGNPTRMSGTFFKAFQTDSRFHKIHISTFDTPRFTDEQVPDKVLREMPTREWQEEMALLYGEDDPEYLVRVLGEFASLTGRPYFRGLSRFVPQEPRRVGRFTGDPRPGKALSWHDDPRGPLRLWETRVEGHAYALWADVAGSTLRDVWDARPRSAQSDAYAAYVVDLTSGRIVASYHDRLADEKTWAFELARLGHAFGKAEIAVEKVGGYGVATLIALRDDLAYPRLWRETDMDSEDRRDEAGTFGWTTSVTTRPQMLAELEAVLREDPSRLRDAGLLDEMRSFVWNDRGRAEADLGYHDDRVMAAAGVMRMFTLHAQAPRSERKPQPKPKRVTERAPRLVGSR